MEPVAFRERVRVHDQYGPVGVIGSGEYEEVGQVQTGIVAGVLEVGGAEVVRHGYSFGGTSLGSRAAPGRTEPRISCAGSPAAPCSPGQRGSRGWRADRLRSRRAACR